MRLYNLTEGRPRLYLIDDQAVPSSLPTLNVTGGVVTKFSRGGVDYAQILWRESGGFNLSGNVTASIALGAGGASTGLGFNRGGGGAGEVQEFVGIAFVSGDYGVSVGAGGASGSAGSNSELLVNGLSAISCSGGGLGGSGTGLGGDGGNGGGAGGNTGIRSGGIGVQNNGGASGGTDRSPGGGGGAGGIGGDGGPFGNGGDGGVGITLSWTEPPLEVGGGGGGGGNAGSTGTASHGGTAGTDSAQPSNADWSGGSGGSRVSSVTPALGGDGFCVLVVRSDEVNV